MSTCPFCKARGVKIADRLTHDGVTMAYDYCGKCGRNYPRQDATAPEHVATDYGPASLEALKERL